VKKQLNQPAIIVVDNVFVEEIGQFRFRAACLDSDKKPVYRDVRRAHGGAA
jgi:hypothetical protein